MIRRDYKSGVEHIYFNSAITNIYAGNETPILAQTNQKTSTILERQRDYEMSISFFEIYGNLPIMYCPIKEGTNTDIDLTNFGINFFYQDAFGNNFNYPMALRYIPSGTNLRIPKSPADNNGVQDFSTGYYGIFRITTFIEMVNQAILLAYINFNVAHPGIHNEAPWVQWNQDTKLISIIFPYSYSLTDAATLQMNALLHNYFAGIPYEYNAYNAPNFADFDILCYKQQGNQNSYAKPGSSIPALPANPLYLEMVQDYPQMYAWTNIDSIIITSPSISIRSEFLPTINNPNSFTPQFADTPFNTNFGSIISYFTIIKEPDQLSVREPIYYQPPYPKWIDLTGDAPLNQVSLNIYIQLNTGAVIPMYLKSQNSIVNMKFEFRRKVF
jgi:hypothetical protein